MSYPIYKTNEGKTIGEPGKPWGDAEKAQWRNQFTAKKRDYFTEVASKVMRCTAGDVFSYGNIDYRAFGSANFPMFGIRTKASEWKADAPLAIITGGVHGYETSGVQGTIKFAVEKMSKYTALGAFNILVLPCVSPWGYENVQRWNPLAIDPNRAFTPAQPGCIEAELAMKCIQEHLARSSGVVLHVDCHETTDTDNTEFRPALIARDCADKPWSEIPLGYYSVCNNHFKAEEYHAAVIAAVQKVTPIAPADENGCLIGEKETLRGCVHIDGEKWGICGALTYHFKNKDESIPYAYAVTTEIYPDMKGVTAEECNVAQEVVITSSLDYVLTQVKAKEQ